MCRGEQVGWDTGTASALGDTEQTLTSRGGAGREERALPAGCVDTLHLDTGKGGVKVPSKCGC